MNARDHVHPFLQQLLDEVLFRCRSLTWSEREEMIGGATVAIFMAPELPAEIDPKVDFSKVIAAVIEGLGTPSVTEEPQAFLYSLSWLDKHSDAGEAWMDEHPEEAQSVRIPPFENGPH